MHYYHDLLHKEEQVQLLSLDQWIQPLTQSQPELHVPLEVTATGCAEVYPILESCHSQTVVQLTNN